MANRTYKALLIFSAWDEELAKKLWLTLKAKGLNITQHQDPHGPFRNTVTVFDNMVNAIEKSEKILVLFTKEAVESGFVSLEIMLALEKSQLLGQMCLYLIAVGLGEEEIRSLKHGLLGSVPHIPVDVNIKGWEDNLLTRLREPRKCMADLLPAGSLAHGQVFSHHFGYLQYILPALESQLKEHEVFKEHPERTCLKYFMLIPFSCNTEIPLKGDSAIMIEFVGKITLHCVHGEKRRVYNPSIYKATKSGEEPIYFIGEFPKVLHSAFQLKDKKIADVDTRLEANRFYFTMNNLLNHRLNPNCNDTAVLLRYPDDEMAVGEVLWSALNEELERVQQNRTGIARELSYFKNMNVSFHTQPCEKDATISCLSDSECDRKVAQNIASVLEKHGKKVVTRSAGVGQWGELDNADWNIFVMSRDSFKGDHCKIELLNTIFRCARDKLIKMLYVISGMRMDEVPNALRWVTMISTEQKNYADIINDQMEGNVVHMQEKMPAGDVSTGLAWAYLLNYLAIQLAGKTETGLDFHGRIAKHLQDRKQTCGCLPFFYIILSSTGKVLKLDVPEAPITNLGQVKPPVKTYQAGTVDREYYIYMYKYRYQDTNQEVCYISEACTPGIALNSITFGLVFIAGDKKDNYKSLNEFEFPQDPITYYEEVCFISEACTPGIALNSMATDLEFAGIEPGEVLRKQIQNLGDLIEGNIYHPRYMKNVGDFTNLFRLIRYDLDGDESIADCVGRHLRADLDRCMLLNPSGQNVETPMDE